MSDRRKLFNPAHQSSMQKSGFFIAIALAAIVILLHFPFGGYEIEHSVVTRYGRGHCPEAPDLYKATADDITKYADQLRQCTDEHEDQILPVIEWRSASPVLEWFGPLLNVFSVLLLTFFLGTLWLWIFQESEADSN